MRRISFLVGLLLIVALPVALFARGGQESSTTSTQPVTVTRYMRAPWEDSAAAPGVGAMVLTARMAPSKAAFDVVAFI